MECKPRCAKGALVSFNLLFWVSGCLLLVLGAWTFLEPAKLHLFGLIVTPGVPRDIVHYAAYALLALGGSVVVVGFFGCCGAIQGSRHMMVVYFVFLFLLLCLELAVAVVTLIYRHQFLGGMEERLLQQLIKRYGHDSTNNNAFTESIDVAQFQFHCCGIRGDADYMLTKWKNDSIVSTNNKRNVPLTCCIVTNGENANSGSPLSVVSRVFSGTVEEPWQHPTPLDEKACQDNEAAVARHKRGCFKELEVWFRGESTILISIGIGTAAFQIVGMVFSICLCRKLGEDV